ncbi:MAG: hypothetical protein A2017_13085 [Lentisphaerae bacterium GWF2_44_16]|nr:MAG: hypothetical protein A2017_13085 [Lentisphaerae bacterium GWF2_44_16]
MKKSEKKERADILLERAGSCSSREEAAKLILSGKVRIGKDHLVRKTSELYPADTEFIVAEDSQYVSRGAYKLLPAIDKYLPDMSGLIALDVGASTGGFTDLMLQHNTRRVYTVDSGRGQLHLKIRSDERVVVHEQTNARLLKENFIPEKVDVITMDLSFISVTAVLPAVSAFLKKEAWAFILIKPQFEASKNEIEKGGVVREQNVIDKCIEKVSVFCEKELSWIKKDIIPSPIKGPKGNQEYIAVFRT